MILHNWGEIEYTKARIKMQEVHNIAVNDGQNHLILCSHPNVFTVGSSEKKYFTIPIVQSDRGGSITCHSFGQNIYYFCFQVKQPVLFYKKVLLSFQNFFKQIIPEVYYNKKNPGFYIQNRKIASLGFRYANGVSLHGVSLNVNVNLTYHSIVSPCNIDGIVPTSLHNENISLSQKKVDDMIIKNILESFNEHI